MLRRTTRDVSPILKISNSATPRIINSVKSSRKKEKETTNNFTKHFWIFIWISRDYIGVIRSVNLIWMPSRDTCAPEIAAARVRRGRTALFIHVSPVDISIGYSIHVSCFIRNCLNLPSFHSFPSASSVIHTRLGASLWWFRLPRPDDHVRIVGEPMRVIVTASPTFVIRFEDNVMSFAAILTAF